MADTIKIVRNNSGSVKTYLGQILNNSDTYEIPFSDFRLWAEDAEVLADVDTGDLIVNDGSSDLNVTNGALWIRLIGDATAISFNGSTTTIDAAVTAADGVDIEQNDSVVGRALTLNVEGAVTVVDEGNDKITLDFTGSNLPEPIWTALDLGCFERNKTFQILNSSGSQSISTSATSPSVIELDSVVNEVSSTGLFTINASNELVFNIEGVFIVDFTSTINMTNSSRSEAMSRLEIDTGSGFSAIPGTEVATYHRTSAQGEASASRSILISINEGDKIRLTANRSSGGGNLETVAQGSGITVFSYIDPAQTSNFEFNCGSIDDDESALIMLGEL